MKKILLGLLVCFSLYGCDVDSTDSQYRIEDAWHVYHAESYQKDSSNCIHFTDIDGSDRTECVICGNYSISKTKK
jgi:hypothetical protein